MSTPSKAAPPEEWAAWRVAKKAEQAEKHFAEVHAQFVQGRASAEELEEAGRLVDGDEEEVTAESILAEFGEFTADRPIGADRAEAMNAGSEKPQEPSESQNRPHDTSEGTTDPYEALYSRLDNPNPLDEAQRKWQALAAKARTIPEGHPLRDEVNAMLGQLQAEAEKERVAKFETEARSHGAAIAGAKWAEETYTARRDAELKAAKSFEKALKSQRPQDRWKGEQRLQETEMQWPAWEELSEVKRQVLVAEGVKQDLEKTAHYVEGTQPLIPVSKHVQQAIRDAGFDAPESVSTKAELESLDRLYAQVTGERR